MTSIERPVNCPRCNQREWAKVSDMGAYYLVSYFVCGKVIKAVKKALA